MSILNRVVVSGAPFFHLRNDEVARSIQNAAQRSDLVGGQIATDAGDDGDSTGDRSFEGDRAAETAGQVEQLGTMLGQQGFVGSDDIFATLQYLRHDGPRRFDASHQLCNDVNFCIVEHRLQVVCDNAGRQ